MLGHVTPHLPEFLGKIIALIRSTLTVTGANISVHVLTRCLLLQPTHMRSLCYGLCLLSHYHSVVPHVTMAAKHVITSALFIQLISGRYNIICNKDMMLNMLKLCTCEHTMQCNAMQCNAMQCNAMQCNAMQCNAMQCNAIKCNAIKCNAIKCNAMQCDAMQCNAMQCNAMQCNAMQCNAIQYNTIQYNLFQLSYMSIIIIIHCIFLNEKSKRICR